MTNTCSFRNCSNPTFEHQTRCTLHCKKDDYKTTPNSLLLVTFIDQLKGYIQNLLNSISSAQHINIVSTIDLQQFSSDLSKVDLEISEIVFPQSGNLLKDDYIRILDLFQKINFNNCTFHHNDKLIYRNCNFYFYNCEFHTDYDVTINASYASHTNKRAIYNKCTFFKSTNITTEKPTTPIQSNLFWACSFHDDIIIQGINLDGLLFDYSKHIDMPDKNYFPNESTSIKIMYCSFTMPVILNDLSINEIIIEGSLFESKLEIKNTTANNFEFKDSNVTKVFDAFKSKLDKAYFYKSIFYDFAGFEKVKFGIEHNTKSEFKTEFIFVTFMNFAVFRETSFYSGLDFERVNYNSIYLPNFLKAFIEPVNTNRETFRTIKHSFDSVGNTAEANKIFVQEMKKLSIELEKKVHKRSKQVREKISSIKNSKLLLIYYIKLFWIILTEVFYLLFKPTPWAESLIFKLNNGISSFGATYTRPAFLFVFFASIYTKILDIHQNLKKGENSFIDYIYSFENTSYYFNLFAKSFIPFKPFLEEGLEFVSLFFYIVFATLIWQTLVAIKRRARR